MNSLCLDQLVSLPDWVESPGDPISADDCGILHLGLGQFSKAHLLVYVDALFRLGQAEWGVVGVSLRSEETVEDLKSQDFLYSVICQSSQSLSAKVVGGLGAAIALGAQGGRNALERLMLDPKIRIVSLTVTEKGYYAGGDGRLNLAHPDIAADLKNPDQPRTAVGWLGLGLKLRSKKGIAPFTVMSLDNLVGNGRVLRQVVLDYIELAFPEIKADVDAGVSFPCSMVDRIVPSQSPRDLELAQKTLGLSDQAVVVTEPFCQWVLEDYFVSGRPDWASVGVELCTEIAPFEAMKLRLLNGAHSAIAYVGLMVGHETVADCMADPVMADFVSRLMLEEILPEVVAPPSVDLMTYVSTLLERFKNPFLHHRCLQIAMDGSKKISQRWLPVLTQRLVAQRSISLMAFGVAAWVIYLQKNVGVEDPLRDQLQSVLAGKERNQQAASVIEMLGFPSDLAVNASVLALEVTAGLKQIDAVGGTQALVALLRAANSEHQS